MIKFSILNNGNFLPYMPPCVMQYEEHHTYKIFCQCLTLISSLLKIKKKGKLVNDPKKKQPDKSKIDGILRNNC